MPTRPDGLPAGAGPFSTRTVSDLPVDVDGDAARDREHPGAQVASVLETRVGVEGTEERLLERILGGLGAKPAAQQPEHLAAVLGVEALERRHLHSLHHLL